ncbi:MAG: hypothetical protein ACXAB7_06955 [Candidatus Kariarchaeaceae archaeon]
MEYSLYKAFVAYVTYIETFRDIQQYREAAKVIRNGLPKVERGQTGFRDISTVKQFVETVIVEEESILELTCIDDAISTIEALSPEAKKILMINPDEIRDKIFRH